MYAAEKGNIAVMDVLIKAGAAIDVQSTSDNTALICAAVRGHEAAVTRLLEAKATVDVPGEGGGTAMMKAAYGCVYYSAGGPTATCMFIDAHLYRPTPQGLEHSAARAKRHAVSQGTKIHR
jgi:hypothetical protein